MEPRSIAEQGRSNVYGCFHTRSAARCPGRSCIRAGYLALYRIVDFFDLPHNPAPKPGDPISVTRAEFNEAYQKLAASGIPLKADRDQAWHDFVGWRVNYDTVLLALCALTTAPTAPWSADRAPAMPPAWLRFKRHSHG